MKTITIAFLFLLALATPAPAQVWPELLRGEVHFEFPERTTTPAPQPPRIAKAQHARIHKRKLNRKRA
jgi:hypothetical protein